MFVIKINAQVVLNPKTMSEKEIILKLKDKNDPEIKMLLKKRRSSLGLQTIGFLAIPAVSFGAAAVFSANGLFYRTKTKEDFQMEDLGRSLIGGSVLFLGTNIYFNWKSKYCYKKAIDKYNHLYN